MATSTQQISEESNGLHRVEGNASPAVDKARTAGRKSLNTEAVATGTIEVIDSTELAKRLQVPESWIRSHTNRKRTRDPIPHYRLGRYIRFSWGGNELHEWLSRQLVSANRVESRRKM